MQGPLKIPNKYSIGKYLKIKKGLRKKDPKSTIKSPSESLQKYISFLIENGAIINKVAVGEFYLKNGLPYSGLIATEKVFTEEIMLKIPLPLILNTKKAYFSELRKIFHENLHFFSPSHNSSWEDHMLLVYLVNEFGKGQNSEWYHLIRNLPRDIDYVVFWEEEELKLLEDISIYRLAKQYRKEYDSDEAFILELAKRYPGILIPEVFTKENIRWIYTHLVTRCFGKYLEYISMIPFAELFNHECVDVYYDLEYFENNPHKPSDYSMEKAKEVPDEEFETYESSEGTNNSEDEEFDSDFEYEKDDIEMEAEYKDSLEKKLNGLSILDEVRMKSDDIENHLLNDFDWGDGFSIFFVREAQKESSTLLERYKAKEIDTDTARNLFLNLETAVIIYKNEVRKFYKNICKIQESDMTMKQKSKFIQQIEEKEKKEKLLSLEAKTLDELFGADPEWKDDKFDNFIMKASWKDQFEKEAQLFFCYGRLSNRTTLLRYGMALEYNKYEHIHIKIPYLQYIRDSEWLVDKIKYFRLSRYMRFKLKRTKINVNLINFCKGLHFKLDNLNYESILKPIDIDLDLKGVRKAYMILQEFLNSFSKSPKENDKLLSDSNITYHEYFAAVYRLERQRLIIFHSRALLVLEEILQRLKNNLSFEDSLLRVDSLESEEEFNRNRIFLADYLNLLKDKWEVTKA